jgi:hypothetical protein
MKKNNLFRNFLWFLDGSLVANFESSSSIVRKRKQNRHNLTEKQFGGKIFVRVILSIYLFFKAQNLWIII